MMIYHAKTDRGEWYFIGTDGLHWRERCLSYVTLTPEHLAAETTRETEVLWIGLELRGAVRVY